MKRGHKYKYRHGDRYETQGTCTETYPCILISLSTAKTVDIRENVSVIFTNLPVPNT